MYLFEPLRRLIISGIPILSILLVSLLVICDRVVVDEKTSYRRSKLQSHIKFEKSDFWKVGDGRISAYTVTDLDGDISPDICYINSNQGFEVHCIQNLNSAKFNNEIYIKLNEIENPEGILSFDFDLDSKNDLLIYSREKAVIYLRSKNNDFKQKNILSGSFFKVSVADYNADFFSDLLTVDRDGKYLVWFNRGNGDFETSNFSEEDLNWMYSDAQSIKFDKIKNKPYFLPGRPISALDLNQDGLLDYFIGGYYFPPKSGEKNKLWLSDLAKDSLVESADELKIEKCGAVENVIAADFDLDSNYEIVAQSGMYDVKDEKFYKTSPCFFTNYENIFEDIGSSIFDETELKDGIISLSAVDANNDGLKDFVWIDRSGRLISKLNKSPIKNNWIGLVFKSKFGSQVQPLVKAEIFDWKNKRLEYMEFSPLTAAGQGDFRKTISLGPETHATVKIFYNKNLIKIYTLGANKYHEIKID